MKTHVYVAVKLGEGGIQTPYFSEFFLWSYSHVWSTEEVAAVDRCQEQDYAFSFLCVPGEMSIEELAAKYAGAYDSDFEMPQESSSEGEEDEDSELDSDGMSVCGSQRERNQ